MVGEVDNNENNKEVDVYLQPSLNLLKNNLFPSPASSTTKHKNIIARTSYIKPSSTQSTNLVPSKLWKVILDSGCTDTMSASLELFNKVTYFYTGEHPPQSTPHVVLGDGTTKVPVK